MIAAIVELSVKWRGLVALVAVVILIGGVFVLRTLPIDAIPDLSDPQVIEMLDDLARHPGHGVYDPEADGDS